MNYTKIVWKVKRIKAVQKEKRIQPIKKYLRLHSLIKRVLRIGKEENYLIVFEVG